MKNFERFSPADWQEDGLLWTTPKEEARARSTYRTVGSLMTAIALTVSLSWVAVSTPPNGGEDRDGGAIHAVLRSESTTSGSKDRSAISDDHIPPRLWPALMRVVEALPEVDDSGEPGPDPFV